MKALFQLLVVLSVFGYPIGTFAVVNGTPVPEDSDLLRSVVRIGGQGRFKSIQSCTGFVITEDFILTAGHCYLDEERRASFADLFEKQGAPGTTMHTFHGVVHPVFWREHTADVIAVEEKLGILNPESYQHDIAVTRIGNQQERPNLRVVETLPDDRFLVPGLEVEAAGFGVTDAEMQDQGPGPRTLRSTKMRIVSINKNLVLVKSVNGGNTAAGDSGGPVYIVRDGKAYVWGITSYGTADTAYVLRINPFREFIRGVMNKNLGMPSRRWP